MRLLSSFVLALGVVVTGTSAAAAEPIFSAQIRGNIADQSIAGFPASRATWDLEKGRVALFRFGAGHAVLVAHVRGLIIPDLGFNPSPDLLARLVCHDTAGTPAEAARTRTVPFPEDGDATLVAVVDIPASCFAPIVLLTGSRDPAGNQPGNWFAVSAF